MARPSKKEERTEQVLQAFQRCVARYGLEGSSLERIAEESGLQRSLVRHFVGNRNDLIQRLAVRVVEQSDQQWQELIDWLPATNAVDPLLDVLFEYHGSDPELLMVVEAMIFASARDPFLKELMQGWMSKFTESVELLLRRDFPNADQADIAAVGFGIVSLYINLDSLNPLGMMSLYKVPARQAAEKLVESLKTSS
ncbi:TetR/AcrR family transcriptional regulator [Endozoicomonadaceae bacterium StTr2]